MIEAYSNNITVSSNSLVPLKKEGKAVPDSMIDFCEYEKALRFQQMYKK